MLKFAVTGLDTSSAMRQKSQATLGPIPQLDGDTLRRDWDDSILYDILLSTTSSRDGSCHDDDSGYWSPGCNSFQSQESLGTEAANFRFLNGSLLFGLKIPTPNRKHSLISLESTESYEFLQDLLDLVDNAQKQRMEDQRGELEKDSLDLPEFLRRRPDDGRGYTTQDDSPLPSPPPALSMENLSLSSPFLPSAIKEINPPTKEVSPPPAPPPPPIGDSGRIKVRTITRPARRRSTSTDFPPPDQLDFITELKGTLSRRSGKNKGGNASEKNEERNEMDSRTRNEVPAIRRVGDCKRINIVRPRVLRAKNCDTRESGESLNSTRSDNVTLRGENKDVPKPPLNNRDIIATTRNIRPLSAVGGKGRTVIPVRANTIVKYKAAVTQNYPNETTTEGSQTAVSHKQYKAEPSHKGTNIACSNGNPDMNKETRFRSRNAPNCTPPPPVRKRRPHTLTDPTCIIAVLESNELNLPESRIDSPCPDRREGSSPVSTSYGSPKVTRKDIARNGVNQGGALLPNLSWRSNTSKELISSYSGVNQGYSITTNRSMHSEAVNSFKTSATEDSHLYPTPTELLCRESATGNPLPLPPSPSSDVEELELADYPPPRPVSPEEYSLDSFLEDSDSDAKPLTYKQSRKPAAYEIKYVGEVTDRSVSRPHKISERSVEKAKLENRLNELNIPQLDPYVTFESDNLKITFV